MTSPLFHLATFRTSHNSYGGGKGNSVVEQLQKGVRGIELDIHLVKIGDSIAIQVGHTGPGDEVGRGRGNPDTADLDPWLGMIAGWVRDHPDASPLTVFMDFKGVHPSEAIARLEKMVAENLDGIIMSPADLPGSEWGSAMDLKGKVLLVLTGNLPSRRNYMASGKLCHMSCTLSEWEAREKSRTNSTGAGGNKSDEDDSKLVDSCRFVNTKMSNRAWAASMRKRGLASRVYGYMPVFHRFSTVDCTFVATDSPFSSWYAKRFDFLE